MREVLLVMAGGAGGAMTRYLVHLMFLRLGASGLAATLAVNVSGSFVLSFLLALSLTRISSHAGLQLQLLFGVGFLSSYTTFSTLMWDTFRLAQEGSLPLGLLNLVASLVIGLTSAALGFLIGRLV